MLLETSSKGLGTLEYVDDKKFQTNLDFLEYLIEFPKARIPFRFPSIPFLVSESSEIYRVSDKCSRNRKGILGNLPSVEFGTFKNPKVSERVSGLLWVSQSTDFFRVYGAYKMFVPRPVYGHKYGVYDRSHQGKRRFTVVYDLRNA